jgi:hypothetical protein
MSGWIVRITTPTGTDEPLIWEFKMLTLDRDQAIRWGRDYQHTLPVATVEAVHPF